MPNSKAEMPDPEDEQTSASSAAETLLDKKGLNPEADTSIYTDGFDPPVGSSSLDEILSN